MELKVKYVHKRFIENWIKVDEEWLSGCVDYFLSEDPQISNGNLYETALEQFRLSDICEIGLRSLPAILNNDPTELKDQYVVQMQYLVDISEPFYEQLRKINNKQLDETDFERQERKAITKKRRTLKLELTDGHTKMTAMEYTPIPCLNTKLPPGCKILLKGPIRCVNKVLLLESKNIKILGGEVGTLEIENAYENVLLRGLGKPINPTPNTDYTEPTVKEEQKVILPPLNPTPISSTASIQPPTAELKKESALFEDDADDLLLGIDVDEQLVNSAEPVVIQNSPTQQQSSNADLSDDDILMEALIENEQAILNNHITAVTDEAAADPPQQTQSLSKSQTIHALLEPNYPFKIRGIYVATIEQLCEIVALPRNGEKDFIVKCSVEKLADRFRIIKTEWKCCVFLCDGLSTETLKTNLNNEVMEKLAGGVSVEELVHMRNLMKDRPQLREDLEDIMVQLKENIENLNCFVRIHVAADADTLPMATDVIDSAPVLERILANKLAKELLHI